MTRARVVRIAIACAFALVLAAGISWYQNRDDGMPAIAMVGANSFASLGGPFTLTDHTGATVTDETYHGRYLLVYFGFTYCPDVCPTELARIVRAIDLMPQDVADTVTPVLVTVDPERDSPEALAQYVALFDPRLVGLTGTEDQIAAIADDYNVYYARVEDDDDPDFYLVDHSSFTYLVGPDGRVRNVLTPRQSVEEIADGVAQVVREDGVV